MASDLSMNDAKVIAVRDAATRLGVAEPAVSIVAVEPVTYPNAALGAPREGEMSFDVLTSGWAFWLTAGETNLEYRADRRQVRLYKYRGHNHLVYPPDGGGC
jgi:hypothetical protein